MRCKCCDAQLRPSEIRRDNRFVGGYVELCYLCEHAARFGEYLASGIVEVHTFTPERIEVGAKDGGC
jgi:hypothetical protein